MTGNIWRRALLRGRREYPREAVSAHGGLSVLYRVPRYGRNVGSGALRCSLLRRAVPGVMRFGTLNFCHFSYVHARRSFPRHTSCSGTIVHNPSDMDLLTLCFSRACCTQGCDASGLQDGGTASGQRGSKVENGTIEAWLARRNAEGGTVFANLYRSTS